LIILLQVANNDRGDPFLRHSVCWRHPWRWFHHHDQI